MAEIRVTPMEMPAFIVGTYYEFQFEATGGTAPYEFFLASGAFPPGMTMDLAGLLSGTATECEGPYQFEVGARSATVLDVESPIEILDRGLRGESGIYNGTGGLTSLVDETKIFARSEFLFDPDNYSDGTAFYFEAVVTNLSYTESRKINIVKQMRGRGSSAAVVHTLTVPPQVEKKLIRFSTAFIGFENDLIPPFVTGPSVTGGNVSREDAYRVALEREPASVKTYPAAALFPSAEFDLHKLRLWAFSPQSNEHTFEFPLTSFAGDASSLDETAVASGASTTSTSYVDIPGAAIYHHEADRWNTIAQLDLMATLRTTGNVATAGLYDLGTGLYAASVSLFAALSGAGPLTVAEPMAVTGALLDGHNYVVRLKTDSGTSSLYKARLRFRVTPLRRANAYTRYAVGADNRESRFFQSRLLDEDNAKLFGSGCGDESVIAGVKAIVLEATGSQEASVALVDAGAEERRVTVSQSATLKFSPDGGQASFPGWFGYTVGDHIPAQNWTVDENLAPITDYIAWRKQNLLESLDDVRIAEWAALLAAYQFELFASYVNSAPALLGLIDINALRDAIIADLETDMLAVTINEVAGSTLTFGSTKSRQTAVLAVDALTPSNRYFGSMSSDGLVQALMTLQLDVTEIASTSGRDIAPGQVLLQRVYKAPRDLEFVFDNTLVRTRNLCFECYFFNLMWEYSPSLHLSAYLPPPPVPVLEVVSVTSKIITIRTDLVAPDDTKSCLVELSPFKDFNGFKVCVKGGPLQSLYALQIPSGIPAGIGFVAGWYVRAKRQDYLGDSEWSEVLFISQTDVDGEGEATLVTTAANGLAPQLPGVSTQVLRGDGTYGTPVGATVVAGVTIGDGVSVITTGVKGYIRIPFNCTIINWTILSVDTAPTSGSIVIDVWKDTFANYPPTVADTITAAAKPTVTTANKASGLPTGWVTSVVSGDVIGFNVDSVTSLTKVVLELQLQTT